MVYVGDLEEYHLWNRYRTPGIKIYGAWTPMLLTRHIILKVNLILNPSFFQTLLFVVSLKLLIFVTLTRTFGNPQAFPRFLGFLHEISPPPIRRHNSYILKTLVFPRIVCSCPVLLCEEQSQNVITLNFHCNFIVYMWAAWRYKDRHETPMLLYNNIVSTWRLDILDYI